MRHEAIREIHEDAVRIAGLGSEAVAYDADGNVIAYDEDVVAAKEAELTTAQNLDELRAERNRLLTETDHWAMSDTPDMTTEQTTYRQALRDITDNATSLDDVTWPEKP